MNPFSIFVIFYATAFLMEMLEKWKHPEFSWMAIGLVILLVFTRITKIGFLIFLLLTTGYFWFFRFPDVANHVNLLIYLNIALIFGGIYSYFIPKDNNFSDREDYYFEMMLPVLRSALAIVYFLAGFHKLNRDFFNPQVSCAKVFFLRLVSAMATNFFGLPLFFWLTSIFLLTVWYLLVKKLTVFGKNKLLNLTILVLIIPLAGEIVLLLKTNAVFLESLLPFIGFVTAIVIVVWEIVGGLLLSVAQWQLPILVFSLMMHLMLAPIGFVDFGALALALILTFIPNNYYQLLIQKLDIKLLNFKVNRVYLYLFINIFGGLLAGISYRIHWIPQIRIITGLLFNLSAFIFLYPLISIFFLPERQRPIWTGVSLLNSKVPKLMCIFPLLLLAFGFSSYLGLGSAGNFSMFSNLKTEGITSNHLLLSKNPWKVFDYQEDTVKIYVAFTEKKERRYDIELNNRPLKGHSLPLVEFKKLIYNWTKKNQKVAMMLEYRGKTYPTKDIINDPTWKTTKRNWEMKLLNFRLISPNQPNECRW